MVAEKQQFSAKRILVRGPNPVGDLVMATSAFADIRHGFPDAEITMCVRPGRGELLEGLDSFDELLVDDSSKGFRAFARLAREIRRRQFDLAVLFTNSFRTALLLRLSGVPQRVGYRKGGQHLFLTNVLEPATDSETGRWAPRPMSEIYGDISAGLGLTPGDGKPRLAVTAELEERAKAKRAELAIGEDEKLIGLAPGASFGGSKVWPPTLLAQLADRVSRERGRRSILIAGPGEDAIADEVVSCMETPVINTANAPLGLALLKPIVRDLELLITMDSGPRHFGAAFDVPTIVVMGPTDPVWTDSNLDFSDVVRHDVPCGPCQKPVCPIQGDGHMICMTEITPDEVYERIQQLDRRIAADAGS